MRLRPFWLVVAALTALAAPGAETAAPALRLHASLHRVGIQKLYGVVWYSVAHPQLRANSRPPRNRETLARLIDYSLLDEIAAEGTNG